MHFSLKARLIRTVIIFKLFAYNNNNNNIKYSVFLLKKSKRKKTTTQKIWYLNRHNHSQYSIVFYRFWPNVTTKQTKKNLLTL